VNGESAVLWTSLYSPGEVAGWALVIDYGRTVVEATASPFLQVTPGAGLDGRMDEATFLAAMQSLRPYPQ
jgi:hypothetical protein